MFLKRYPFRAKPPRVRIGHYREYSPGILRRFKGCEANRLSAPHDQKAPIGSFPFSSSTFLADGQYSLSETGINKYLFYPSHPFPLTVQLRWYLYVTMKLFLEENYNTDMSISVWNYWWKCLSMIERQSERNAIPGACTFFTNLNWLFSYWCAITFLFLNVAELNSTTSRFLFFSRM